MKRNLLSAVVVVLLSSVGYSQGNDSLTIRQVIDRVFASHPAVRQAADLMQASLAKVDQSRSSYYPQTDAEVGYTRLGPVAEIDFPGLGLFKLYPENNYDGHISIEQTVYDFGKNNASVELNESDVRSAADHVEIVKTNLAYEAIQLFYSIPYLRHSIQVQDEQIDALNRHLLVTQDRVRSGSATDFDVLTTQVRVSAAATQKIDLANSLVKQEAEFRRLLDLPSSSPVLIHEEFSSEPILLTADSLIALALQQRVELQVSRDEEKNREAKLHSASLHDMPSVKANLAYGIKNGYIPDLDVLRGNWVAGILLQVPIFNGFEKRGEEDECRANLLAAQAHTSDLERSVTMEVEQAISDVKASREKIETSDLQVRQAMQAVEMASVRYESGTITNLDLIDAQTALAQAKLFHLQALYHYVLSKYSLQKSIGALLQE